PSRPAAQPARTAAQPARLSPEPSECRPAPLAERAARVLVMGLPEVTEATDPMVDKLLELQVGGVLITPSNVESTSQVTSLISSIRARAAKPMLVSTDEEPGRVSTFVGLFGPTPSARRLAAERSPAEVREFARQTGVRLTALGVDFDLAPVADLDAGTYGGVVGDRSFSSDPDTAFRYALAYASGLWDAGVRPLAKHFPGHGRSSADTHVRRTETVLATLDDLMATDIRPFRDLIDAGIPVVMMNHVSYSVFEPDVPASLSPKAYQLLRSLGFRGVAITDSVGMAAVNLRYHPSDAAVAAVQAGADGVLMTDGWAAENMRDTLVEAVQSGRLSEARLNEAAARMMALAGGDPVALACQPVEVPELRRSHG
ncbi:MAG: glycoside hydrolase family 3 protein, partial [Actinomycetota bacterium]|nr:glycoside hydrolase family 3 protein [Actinomycetota bacterium]